MWRAAYFAVPGVGSARNSSTSRRWRLFVIVSRTTRPAACSARSATSLRSSASARCFSAAISSAARTRIRSSSSRVAAMSASRVSWATFWARARMSFDSRRASARVASRSCSAVSRSRFACSASRRPCSMRSRREARRPLTCLPNARYRIVANTMKLAEATTIQKKLIARPPPAASAAAATPPAASGAVSANRFMAGRPGYYPASSGCGGLEDDGQDRDHDREDAEPFSERRAEDELGSDLGCRVRVPADGRGCEPGQDADADARPDDAQCGEAGSDELHGCLPPMVAPRVRLAVACWSATRCAHAQWRRHPTLGHVGDTFVLLGVVRLHRDDRVHEHERREDERLHEVEQAFEQEHPGGNERDRERRDDPERDLTAEDIAEESHRQRDRLDELEQKLNQADEQVDDAASHALAEAADDEKLAQVATHAEAAEALEVEVQERHQREPDRHVHVARGRPQELHLAEERQQAAPVREQDEQEERREKRDVGAGIGPAQGDGPVLEALPRELERVLEPARDLLEHPPGRDEHDEQGAHHEPHRQQRVADADAGADDRQLFVRRARRPHDP